MKLILAIATVLCFITVPATAQEDHYHNDGHDHDATPAPTPSKANIQGDLVGRGGGGLAGLAGGYTTKRGFPKSFAGSKTFFRGVKGLRKKPAPELIGQVRPIRAINAKGARIVSRRR